MALIDADQEGLVSYLRGSARSVVKVLLASFLKHQGKEKEFLAADRGLNKSKSKEKDILAAPVKSSSRCLRI